MGYDVHTVRAIIYSENLGTHTKNIKNTTLKHRRKLEKSTF